MSFNLSLNYWNIFIEIVNDFSAVKSNISLLLIAN